MPVISPSIEPLRVTRVFFDCRAAVVPNPADLRRIERSIALPEADDDAQVTLSLAA